MGELGNLFNLIFTFPILNGLVLLYHLFGDFALSIIVLTLIIKLALFPLTLKQLKSMKATQALQPLMAEVRKKYGKDQQAQALAMQALYKEYGVNPVAGCLPLLIQLPVLYGLYNALNTILRPTTHSVKILNDALYAFVPHFTTFPSTSLNWFTFINPGWYISLGQPDPTHILPIIAALATFTQLRMSQPKLAPGATPDPSTQSMRMMQYIMPVVTLFFGWTFPAGLALYWTISTTFQGVQQYFVTGWGSLLVKPDFKVAPAGSGNGSTKNSVVEARRERTQTRRPKGTIEISEEASDDAEEDGQNTRLESPLRTSPRPGGSSYNRRRQRMSSSASARRRGSTQRSRG